MEHRGLLHQHQGSARCLTKSLGRIKFQELRSRIGMVQLPLKT
jgi:ABC-type molybdenum transport system ATPase subunit/photorepair protein PhrA